MFDFIAKGYCAMLPILVRERESKVNKEYIGVSKD